MWTPDVQWVVEEVLVVVEEESPWHGKVSPFKSFYRWGHISILNRFEFDACAPSCVLIQPLNLRCDYKPRH